ncbi:hypothetical protein OH492_20630 [Vibrio chagasii]|nr:hypothetical protein [Vibrio chagasii]
MQPLFKCGKKTSAKLLGRINTLTNWMQSRPKARLINVKSMASRNYCNSVIESAFKRSILLLLSSNPGAGKTVTLAAEVASRLFEIGMIDLQLLCASFSPSLTVAEGMQRPFHGSSDVPLMEVWVLLEALTPTNQSVFG